MFLDLEDSLDLRNKGVFEPFETELIKKEIKKGNVVLDIGAHIGYYTLIFANLVGEEGKVFAFEPNPVNFSLLKKNVEINGYKNVILVQKAVSNKSGKIKLYLCSGNSGMNRIYKSKYCSNSINIEAISLDEYLGNYKGKIDFIKIDTEGAEFVGIQGMYSVINKNKNLKIITEFAPVSLKEFGIEPKNYLNLLIKYGFKLYEINEKKTLIEPVVVNELLKIYQPKKENLTNLLCIKDT